MSTIPSQTRLFQTATLKKSTVGGVAIRVSSPSRATLIAAAVAMLGCGGKSLTPAHDAGPAHETTPTDDASTNAACEVPTPTTSPPYAVQFELHDDGASSVFLLSQCGGLGYGVSSCAAGFADHLADRPICVCSCPNPQCGNFCGACPADESVEIAAGASKTLPWDGVSVTIETLSNGQCSSTGDLPAGRYRFSITFYDSADAALARSGPRIVSRDFSLPAPNGIVDVSLAPAAADVCDPTPDVPVATCTGAEAHDVPCSLATGLSFAYVGGLSSFNDSDAIAPPNAFTLTRTYADRTKTPLTCAPKIPRCSRDARVVTTGDITRALAQPGVRPAFGPNTPVFGTDAREADGDILIVTADDGTSVGLGGPCSGCARPPTAALNALQVTLGALSEQQRADVSCAAFGQ